MRPVASLLALLILASTVACGPRQTDQASSAGETVSSPKAGRAPEALSQRIHALGRDFDGDVGIAVRDVRHGWTIDHQGGKAFPQQSVAKLWVAVALLDAVDRGDVRLNDIALVRAEDLSVFHQPIRRLVGRDGFLTSLDDLLTRALTESDNAANQMLVTRLGGPEAVQATIERKQLGRIRFGPGERELQSSIAGLTWRPEFSFGWNFQAARETLPAAYRREALDAYLSDPMDGATPLAIVTALSRLQSGDLLSKASTEHMLTVMSASRTGPKRLRQGAGEGWRVYHKTGTGQVLGPVSTGYNDVAVLVAPDGHAYAAAVMIGRTTRGIPERQALMGDVARAIVAQHEGRDPNDVGAATMPAATSGEDDQAIR